MKRFILALALLVLAVPMAQAGNFVLVGNRVVAVNSAPVIVQSGFRSAVVVQAAPVVVRQRAVVVQQRRAVIVRQGLFGRRTVIVR